MIHRFGLMAVLVCNFMSPALSQPATVRDSANFVTVLDQIEGDEIPSALPSWTAFSGDPDGLSVLNGNGTLSLTTTSAFDRWYNRGVPGSQAESALDASVGWTWEARLRIDNVATPGGSAFDLVTRDNTGNAAAPWLVFYEGGLGTRPPGNTPNLIQQTGLFDDFETVRMAYDGAENKAYVYVNNALVGSDIADDGFVNPSTIFLGRSGGATGTGTVTLDYIRFDTTGAYAPAVTFDPSLMLEIDRGTQELTFINNTDSAKQIVAYSVISDFETLDPSAWTSVASSNPDWIEFTRPGTNTDLSEGEEPASTGITLNNGGATLSLGPAWIQQPREDISVRVLLADDTVEEAEVVYTGTGPFAMPFVNGDFDLDYDVDQTDWNTFLLNHGSDFTPSGDSLAETYFLGDLTGDKVNDIDDFLAFQAAYDSANTPGAFASMLKADAVPEPSAAALSLMALAGAFLGPVRPSRIFCMAIAAATMLMLACGTMAQDLPKRASSLFSTALDQIEGDVLPGSLGSWSAQLGNPDGQSVLNGDGTFSLTTTSAFDRWWNRDSSNPDQVSALDAGVGWTWEARVRVDAAGTNGSALDIVTRDNTGPSAEPWIVFYENGVGTRPPSTTPNLIQQEGLFDDFQRVRMAYDGANNTAYVYLNEVLIASDIEFDGFEGPSTIFIGRSSSATGTGAATIDYVRFDTTGAYRPVPPTLRINSVSGQGWLVNETGFDIDLTSYQIESPNGALDAETWQSLEENPAFPAANGTLDGWAVGDGSGEFLLVESNLLGSSILTDGATVSLGRIYNPAVGDAEIAFKYALENVGFSAFGDVEFVTGSAGTGDFNGDGTVNLADYTVWRDSLGAATDAPIGDAGDGNPGVTAGDYAVWKQQFGLSPGSLGQLQGQQVPEPSTALLLASAFAVFAFPALRRKGSLVVVFVFVTCVAGSRASELDRLYSFGDAGTTDPLFGASVFDGGSVGFFIPSQAVNKTGDDIYEDDVDFTDAQDLTVRGTPEYASVAGRPGAVSGFGIRFNSDDDYLIGANLNSPANSQASIGYDDGLEPPGPLDYTGISNRLFQLWVKPNSGTVANTQSVVMDSNQHGLRIENGNWSMRYAGDDYDSGVPVDTVTNNGWTHAMVARPFGPSVGSFLYINGEAVAFAAGAYDGGAHEELVVGSNTSRDGSDNGFGGEFNGANAEHFRGVVDDLSFSVIGQNAAQDFGAFSFSIDNEYARLQLSSLGYVVGGVDTYDLTGDGVISGDGLGSTATDDVSAFIENWLYKETLNGRLVGDLSTRLRGDFNSDGIVDLLDWRILRMNHISAASLNLGHLLADRAQVPEPSAVSLGTICIGGLALRRRLRA